MKKGLIPVVAGFLCIFGFTSCGPSVRISVSKDYQSATVSFDTYFSKETSDTLAQLMGAMGQENSSSQFITSEDVISLMNSAFIEDVTATVTKDNRISASGKISNLSVHPLTKAGIFKCSKESFSLYLGTDALLNLYNLLDADSQGYIDLLCAPVFNDETSSESEYKENLTTVYGEQIAAEIADSSLNVTVENKSLSRTDTKKVKLGKLLAEAKAPYFSVTVSEGK